MYAYLPFLFRHIIKIFSTVIIIGTVYCRLSIIDIKSSRILISECIDGITQLAIIMINTITTRILNINFPCFLSFLSGQRSNNFRQVRFNTVAHS